LTGWGAGGYLKRAMKPPRLALSLLTLFVLSAQAWADPSFYKNQKLDPTPIPPPQVVPVEGDLPSAKATPTVVVVPVLKEAIPTPEFTPVAGKTLRKASTAGILSAFFPGAGHVYAGEPLKGVFFAGAFGLTLWQSIRNFSLVEDPNVHGSYISRNQTAGSLYGLAALAAYGFGIQDAYASAHRYNRRYHLSLTLGPHNRQGLQLAWVF